jgi:hypothetical protein
MPATQHDAVRTGEHRPGLIKSAVGSHARLRAEVANKATAGQHTAGRAVHMLSAGRDWQASTVSRNSRCSALREMVDHLQLGHADLVILSRSRHDRADVFDSPYVPIRVRPDPSGQVLSG